MQALFLPRLFSGTIKPYFHPFTHGTAAQNLLPALQPGGIFDSRAWKTLLFFAAKFVHYDEIYIFSRKIGIFCQVLRYTLSCRGELPPSNGKVYGKRGFFNARTCRILLPQVRTLCLLSDLQASAVPEMRRQRTHVHAENVLYGIYENDL